MFGWGKKPEGFEWHKYVRTTIKLRRDARRDKVDRMKQSAMDGARAAGDAAGSMAREGAHQAAVGAKAAAVAAGSMSRSGVRNLWAGSRIAAGKIGQGSRVAVMSTAHALQTMAIRAVHGLRAAATGLGTLALATGHALSRGLNAIAQSDRLQPALHLLGRPGVSTPLAVAGVIGLVAGVTRPALGFGFDRDARVAVVLGLLCLLLSYGPRVALGMAPGISSFLVRLHPRLVGAAVLASLTLLIGGAVWGFLPGSSSVPGLGQLASLTLPGTKTVDGRATALTGDTLRIDGTIVRLAGIEAPEREQRCQRPGNRRWRCAEAAADALTRLVRRRALTCQVKGTDEAGRAKAVCFDGTTDIGATLVSEGHVFAEPGFMSRYGKQETAAQSAKVGLWRGTAERPADFRARTWEEAKRAAPEGCPIKGQVAGSDKVYLLPWSAEYTRVRVSKARGERWFCSEQEAISAGWRASSIRG